MTPVGDQLWRSHDSRLTTHDSKMTDFIPGLQLSEALYREAVAPILAREFPRLPYSAARIGTGSDVLGFDTVRSTDHEWGPRLLLFLSEADAATHGPAIVETLRHTLPREIRGYPTNFGPTDEAGVSVLQPIESGPVEHKVEVTTLPRFLQERLGITSAQELDVLDWLTFSEQALLEVTAGALFHDGLGTLAEARDLLAYYPHDIWLYLLAAQWARISQQEPFVGRTGEVGDELGSALIAADLVQDVMRLGFLMERRYAPYSKWFGSAFAQLGCAARLTPTWTWCSRLAVGATGSSTSSMPTRSLPPCTTSWASPSPYRPKHPNSTAGRSSSSRPDGSRTPSVTRYRTSGCATCRRPLDRSISSSVRPTFYRILRSVVGRGRSTEASETARRQDGKTARAARRQDGKEERSREGEQSKSREEPSLSPLPLERSDPLLPLRRSRHPLSAATPPQNMYVSPWLR